MRILLDENLPRPLAHIFAEHSASTVQEEGLAGTRNGDLLACAEGKFDVFLTADKNLSYQQNLSSRTIAIVELPPNRLLLLRSISARITAAVDRAEPGSYVEVTL